MSDVSLIDDFGVVYVIHRYQAQSLLKGKVQQPLEILDTSVSPPVPFQALMSVQPMNGFQVMNLPEGWRNKEPVTVFSASYLQVADETLGTLGDRFNWNGYLYEFMKRSNWGGTDLPHYKYTAVKVEHA